MGETIKLSKQYGTEAGVGGDVDLKKGSISVTSGSQEYDLNATFAEASESGNAIEIKRVYYESTPAMQRFFAPYATTGYGTINMVECFGFGDYSPAVSFTLMQLYEDLLRFQGSVNVYDDNDKDTLWTRVFYSDSELIVKQLIGEYKIKNDRMKKLNNEVNLYLTKLSDWSINHVRRENNMRAEQLSKIGMEEAKSSK